MKVLITDVGSRKAFDTVNIVQRLYGYDCILCSARDHHFQLPLIYGQQVHQLRNLEYAEFETDFAAILREYEEEELVYLPVAERMTRLLYQYLEKFEPPNLKYLLPTRHDFDLTSNKGRFQAFCEQHRFPVPKSYKTTDLENLRTDFRPLIMKPHAGEGSVGLKHIDQPEQLEVLQDFDESVHLLQDKVISDQKVSGAFFLCRGGQVISYYVHQRLRTFPVNGGVTVFSRAVDNPEIIDIGTRLLESMKWDGVAMVEFMYDVPSDSWKIIELNPRLWGSLMLSAFNGSDLLKHYIESSRGANPEPSGPKREVFIRWIYPFDLLNLLKRHISWREFASLRLKETCYINFTYSTFYRSLSYLLYFTINFSSIRRFIKKLV